MPRLPQHVLSNLAMVLAAEVLHRPSAPVCNRSRRASFWLGSGMASSLKVQRG